MPKIDQPLGGVLDFVETRFASQIRARCLLEAQPGTYAPMPPQLDPRLRKVLEQDGIHELYAHQAEAYEAIRSGRDSVLVSRTASGKTLSFLLPLLDDWMHAPSPFGVLLLYPTKALSRDQENTMGRLMQAAVGSRKLGTFDGDTPREERQHIQRSADFVVTNPDMLHAGILPNHHRGWKSFLSRLKYIVVDEVHTYRGAFGSHVSNVFRRLLRVCEMHGSSPVFIGCSATIGNPGEHVEALFHRPVQVIDRDGAPRPPRSLYLVNPPLFQSDGAAYYRKGPGSVSVPLIRKATAAGVRTICFCRARQEVERLYRSVIDGHSGIAGKIKPYRGGLLPSERRQLERDLFSGALTTIITTNALELGIDIGTLDLCILSGHPGSVASFWQQTGRVGRKGANSAIVFIARNTPIDQYLVNHPDFILRTPVEQAWLNADNPYILLQHIPCAAHEYPLRPAEPMFTDRAFTLAVDVLAEEKTLVPYHDCLRFALPDYPARGVNLRGMTDYNIEIHCGTEIIGEIDPIGARGTLYKDAIYQHLGNRYMSMDLDLDKKLCRVERVAVDYYTEAVWESRVEMTGLESEQAQNGATVRFGDIHVNKQPKLYKKIRERSFENIGYGPITLPPFEYDTTGLSLRPPPEWKRLLDEKDRRYLGAALRGLSYLLRRTAPSLCMADVSDIETDVGLFDEEDRRWESTLYLYDAHEGGVGYAEKICEQFATSLALCRAILAECECESGCPACVPPVPQGTDDEELERFLVESNASKACTLSLLDALIDGRIRVPEVRTVQSERGRGITPPPEDEETIRMNQRLNKAAGILRRKREREH